MTAMPDEVQDICGYASHLPQSSYKHSQAKPLKGLGAGVLEVLELHHGDTYRAVYTA
ncbi:hypothetical protein [Rugamonas aquatica]|uniref:hypothetical protein n=1 Tax=Rugamonas aquatica TaxID=2743357 RepID=UPI001583FCE3|nr:hypothetical protein [Rugamonas aquatica]